MTAARATVRTPRASFYLELLCKHFALKVKARYEGTQGEVDFAPGLCRFEADHAALHIRCRAEREAELQRVLWIVQDHVLRFGKQDALELTWDRAADNAEA